VKKLTLLVDSFFGYYEPEGLFRAVGMKKLREIRGCKEVHVEAFGVPPNWGGDRRHILNEQVRHFETVLRGELCQEKEEVSISVAGIIGELKDSSKTKE
jgi:hypothetical protein